MMLNCWKSEVGVLLISLILIAVTANPSANSSIASKHFKRAVIQAYGLGEPTIITNDITQRRSSDDYLKLRGSFFKREQSRSFGSSITLNDREIIANEIIMEAKKIEHDLGLLQPHAFNPSRHFFKVLDKIRDSKLFQLLEKMPKGAILHAHDTAICSTDFLIELTYWDLLWMSYNEQLDLLIFKFSKNAPFEIEDGFSNWTSVASERQAKGAALFDEDLRKRMSLYPRESFLDINDVWENFMVIFGTIDGLLTYAPAWKAYYYNALKEVRADGVSYLEFRSTLPVLYELNGTIHDEIYTAALYKETADQFKQAYPDFIGSKLIYAPLRNVDKATIFKYIDIAIQLKAKFPDYFAGFDLVGQEDLGRPLIDFADQLLTIPDDIDFYFHAGETNWFGATNDENLIDAVLLGTKRIGHGYALLKHPSVLDVVLERNIAIEVNPISNQVLLLVGDNRNHPCSYLFANNYPVVISSDDPSFWKAKPLSHDFYIAFLGIASAHADLRLLKQLAINSIAYSALNNAEKELAFVNWQAKWDDYIEVIIKARLEHFKVNSSAINIQLQSNRIS